ncbi:MAG TPA: TIGR03862 family flavoprotein [Burkholderiaceae bacterium]|jgi:hypothetical protein|nr:TIGR03862 family flavoprotein [Burkholderiaceae bacterium]
MSSMPTPVRQVAVIGAGPAGLMAAEALQAAGHEVHVFDAMPSVGRKFLLAGVGGLNLTHSEPRAAFVQRYGARGGEVDAWLAEFDPEAVRAWADALGHATFVGTSGRVFPADMKAAPLLRAWLHRLRNATTEGLPVRFHMRHRWTGQLDAVQADATRELMSRKRWEIRFETPSAQATCAMDAVVLALGGASWPRLGSDGAWVASLADRGIDIAPLRPANCGFDIAPTAPGRTGWSDHLRERHAGAPLKAVALTFHDEDGEHRQLGEFVLTRTGIEGSLVYAHSARLRDAIARHGRATVLLDLLPQFPPARVLAEVQRPRGARSLATHLKSRLNLQGAKAALLHELLTPEQLRDPATLARALQSLPLPLAAPRPVDEAISTAGGVRLEALDKTLMLQALPGVSCAGEMLDWEAPTGGYLLTACLASGRVAARGIDQWLASLANDPCA